MSQKKVSDWDIVNAIREEQSETYKNNVPIATSTNMGEVGRALDNYVGGINAFTGTLINKIGLQLWATKTTQNKLAFLKRGMLSNASDIEEIYIGLIDGVDFDGTGTDNPFSQKKPDVDTMYHKETYKKKYKVTVSEEQVKQAFQTTGGVMTLTMQIVNRLHDSANRDEYLNFKELMVTIGKGEEPVKTKTVTKPIDEVTSKKFMKDLKLISEGFTFDSKQFNAKNVLTNTSKSEQVLFLNYNIKCEIDIELLAKTFNMDMTNIDIRLVTIDTWSDEKMIGMICDRETFLIYDTLNKMTSIENPDALYTNYWLHVWQLHSYSKFKNAVILKEA